MERYPIQLTSLKDVEKFVNTAEKYDFTINIKNTHSVLDGRSLIGIVSLGLNNPLEVLCQERNKNFELFLERFRPA